VGQVFKSALHLSNLLALIISRFAPFTKPTSL